MQPWKTEIACQQGSGTSISGNVPSQCRALNLSIFIYNVTMELSIILNWEATTEKFHNQWKKKLLLIANFKMTYVKPVKYISQAICKERRSFRGSWSSRDCMAGTWLPYGSSERSIGKELLVAYGTYFKTNKSMMVKNYFQIFKRILWNTKSSIHWSN
jgi:hypothetical protein